MEGETVIRDANVSGTYPPPVPRRQLLAEPGVGVLKPGSRGPEKRRIDMQVQLNNVPVVGRIAGRIMVSASWPGSGIERALRGRLRDEGPCMVIPQIDPPRSPQHPSERKVQGNHPVNHRVGDPLGIEVQRRKVGKLRVSSTYLRSQDSAGAGGTGPEPSNSGGGSNSSGPGSR